MSDKVISVPSIKGRVNVVIMSLQQIELPAPGYNPEEDAEIWDWVNTEDIVKAQSEISNLINELLHVNQRLTNRLAERIEH